MEFEITRSPFGFVIWIYSGDVVKCLQLRYMRSVWKENGVGPFFRTYYNGAVPGQDQCYDRTWNFGYWDLNWTNFGCEHSYFDLNVFRCAKKIFQFFSSSENI